LKAGEKIQSYGGLSQGGTTNNSTRSCLRMIGLREVFSRVNYGAMAVAIGERDVNTHDRFLWLFRDDERPLHCYRHAENTWTNILLL